MSAHARLPAHPVVTNRRRQELAILGAAGLAALGLALGVSLDDPHPNMVLTLAIIAAVVGIVGLLTNRRLAMSVTLLALYLGLLEGPVKLGTGGHEAASVVRDILIYAVAVGALLRLIASRQRLRLPPLSGWVLAWVTLVLIEAFNPKTHGITKVLGGYRQQLEWVPFFFFGYALMRSKKRFRKYFIVLGVIALANGIVSTYQTGLSPSELASWGPGYRELVYGSVQAGKKGGLAARTFAVGGVARVRPPGLGTDAGFGGGTGVLALTATLALLASVGLRRRWPYLLLCFGALAGIATGEGRLQVVGAAFALIAFTLLSVSAGRRVTRPLAVLLGVVVLAIPAGIIFSSAVGSSTFARYSSLESLGTSSKDTKTASLGRSRRSSNAPPSASGSAGRGRRRDSGAFRPRRAKKGSKPSARAPRRSTTSSPPNSGCRGCCSGWRSRCG